MKSLKLQDPKITFLVNRDYTDIEIFDSKSNTTFVKIKLTPEQLSQVLSRQGYVDCSCEVSNLYRVGKTHECKDYVFEIPEGFNRSSNLTENEKTGQLDSLCVESLFKNEMFEWIPDAYYQSQDSFFTKGKKKFARTTIRRWI